MLEKDTVVKGEAFILRERHRNASSCARDCNRPHEEDIGGGRQAPHNKVRDMVRNLVQRR